MVANLKLVANSTWHEESKATLDSVANKNIDELSLNPVFNETDETTPSYTMLAIVLAAHLAILAGILTSRHDVTVINKVMVPMTVSLVNMPSSDEQQLKPEPIPPQQPEVIEIPKKQEQQKVKQMLEKAELPAKELATTKPVLNAPVEQPVMAEAAVSEIPIKAESPAQVVEAQAKIEAVAEPAIEPPRFGAAYLNNPAPAYPSVSRRSGEQGRVLLRVLVSENGLAESVQLDSSSGYENLDRAAIEAVKKWSFVPAKRSNQPVSAYVLVPVKFSLSS